MNHLLYFNIEDFHAPNIALFQTPATSAKQLLISVNTNLDLDEKFCIFVIEMWGVA